VKFDVSTDLTVKITAH